MSQVHKFLSMVWTKAGTASGERSWDLLNGAMCAALRLAVEAHFTFEADDFAKANADFYGWRWFNNATGGEGLYSLACCVERHHGVNLSACIAFEKWKGREPFIYKDRQCKSGRRLAVGSCIEWGGHRRVRVTSFDDAAGTLTACVYELVKAEDGINHREKVVKRFRINHAALREANAACLAAMKTKRVEA